MQDVIETLKRLYDKQNVDEQYNHPIQTTPKTKPGITGEEPEDIKSNDFGDEGSNTSYSSKRVNKSHNREFEDEDDED
jgi:hypothetical protein